MEFFDGGGNHVASPLLVKRMTAQNLGSDLRTITKSGFESTSSEAKSDLWRSGTSHDHQVNHWFVIAVKETVRLFASRNGDFCRILAHLQK